MPRNPETRLVVAVPKGTELRGTHKGDVAWEIGNGPESHVELAKDVAEALRAKGYNCKVYITREVTEEY